MNASGEAVRGLVKSRVDTVMLIGDQNISIHHLGFVHCKGPIKGDTDF